jgi:hypothetical protein
MKRRREFETEPRRSRRLAPFPFLDLLDEMRREVYARLPLSDLVHLARASRKMAYESKGMIPVLPYKWREAWERVSKRHLHASSTGFVAAVTSGIPNWQRVFKGAFVSARTDVICWSWWRAKHTGMVRYELSWECASRWWYLSRFHRYILDTSTSTQCLTDLFDTLRPFVETLPDCDVMSDPESDVW